jgi:hypothetical protein
MRPPAATLAPHYIRTSPPWPPPLQPQHQGEQHYFSHLVKEVFSFLRPIKDDLALKTPRVYTVLQLSLIEIAIKWSFVQIKIV